MKHTHRAYVRIGFLLMVFAVVFGAFGSHVLKEYIGEAELNTWDIGIRYHMVHALAVIILGVTHRHFDEKKLGLALGLFILGIFIFSGSLYFLAMRNIWGNDSFKIALFDANSNGNYDDIDTDKVVVSNYNDTIFDTN
ncbi:MAG: DUF423 domain-containing protein, partial [Bacteroidetes bacterium]|nr:DUF423 domain-containing protein [Bacteroidota bacterium]